MPESIPKSEDFFPPTRLSKNLEPRVERRVGPEGLARVLPPEERAGAPGGGPARVALPGHADRRRRDVLPGSGQIWWGAIFVH